MRLLLFSISFIIVLWPLYSSAQRNFATQGEQEDYWATEIFKNNYSKQTFERFNGQITEISSYLIKYDSAVLKILTPSFPLKQIFTLGIFYPGIFNDPRIYDESSFTKPIHQEINKSIIQTVPDSKDTSTQNISRHDTISISTIEELPFLSNSPKMKRFRMWVYRKRLLNPIVYFIELTNDKATMATNLSTFIEGSTLTFVREGWLII